MSIVNRIALVTGGSGGIGRAVARSLALEGASVVVLDQKEERAQEVVATLSSEFGANHVAVRADVSSKDDVILALQKVRESCSAVPSIVVNNAGITRDALLLKATEEQFDEVIKVNLKGTFLVTQVTSQAMIKEKVKGSIVNISSLVAKSGNIGQVSYSASKGGVVSMTKTCARELAKFDIRCNTILPGFIKTQMTDAVPEVFRKEMISFIPLGRMGRPEEIAEVCLFLATEKSSYITGACIEASGGLWM